MNIGIDITQIQYRNTGVSRFTFGLLDSIISHGGGHTWRWYYHSHGTPFSKLGFDSVPKNISVYEVYLPERIEQRMTYSFPFTSRLLSSYLYPGAQTLDWLVSSDWIEPILPVRHATIVHDLVFRRYPETVDAYILETQHKRLKRVEQQSDLIFVDSEITRKDMMKFYPAYSHPLIVNYPGVHLPVTHLTSSETPPLNLKRPYILAVGKQEPRKNYERLIASWKPLREMADLVIVGQPGWGNKITCTDERFHLFESVNDEVLSRLYRHAQVFAFVSLYEGFGYPLIEALSFGIPSLVTKDSSLAEIGGDAVQVCDAQNADTITSHLKELLMNNKLRKRLSEKGKHIASTFTWKSYYDIFIQSLTMPQKI